MMIVIMATTIKMTMFNNDLMMQFTFGHSDELCRHVSELYLIIPPKGHSTFKKRPARYFQDFQA